MATSRLAYVGSSGERVEMDARPIVSNRFLPIRGRQWSYELSRRSIRQVSRDAREATLTVDYLTTGAADAARRVMDRDVALGTPGTLVSGEWSQRAYVVAQEPSDRYHGWVRADLTVLLLDGVWRRLVTTRYGKGDAGSDYGKAYTYGYDYDYAPPSNARTLTVDAPAACPIRLVIFGYARNPSITIGDNTYAFDVEVPTGAYLLVDTRPDPTVTLVDSAGRETDAFASARRGAGLGSGEYAFQPVEPGVTTVGWDNSFGFDLGVWLEEGEIPWTS